MVKTNRSIRFNSADIPFSLKERSAIKNWLMETAQRFGYSISDLQFIFCSDDFLLDINQRFLNHDDYTDIITFDWSEEKTSICGEIYISIPRVRENGKLFLSGFRDKLHRVMVHGLLHLCGLEDKGKKEKEIMRQAEQRALSGRNF
jgi:rRNA maturation RNase YbeY